MFVWRLKSYSVTRTPAYCAEDAGPHCFTFSVLGQDAALYARPEPEIDPTHIAEELNLPVPIRRLALYIEESLYRGIKWVVFEPNDSQLWAQIRLNVGAFMHNLFIQGYTSMLAAHQDDAGAPPPMLAYRAANEALAAGELAVIPFVPVLEFRRHALLP